MANDSESSGNWRAVAVGLAWMVAGAALTLAFLAYQQPDLLFNAVNLRYCG